MRRKFLTSLNEALFATGQFHELHSFDSKVQAELAREEQRELAKRTTPRTPEQQREAYYAAEARREARNAKRAAANRRRESSAGDAEASSAGVRRS